MEAAVAGEAHPIDGVVACACCHRFPLVGEVVSHHAGPRRAGWVCATCESVGRGAKFGIVDRIDRVRSLGGAINVRVVSPSVRSASL